MSGMSQGVWASGAPVVTTPADAATRHHDVDLLFSSHFVQGKGYRTWRSQGAKDWLLTYIYAGKGRFGYRGGELFAEANDVVCVAPDTLHDYGVEPSLESWEFFWAHFRARSHWLPYLKLSEVSPGLFHLPIEPSSQEEIKQGLSDISACLASALGRREDFAMNALEKVLLLLSSLNPRGHSHLDPRIVKAQAYLRQKLAERITLSELAETCHLSSSRLSHLFREQLDMTPLEFLETERLERAKRLLELSTLAVQAVAAEAGFNSPFYFSRRFKRYTGLSPSEFRKRCT